jgi:hypothetical protein
VGPLLRVTFGYGLGAAPHRRSKKTPKFQESVPIPDSATTSYSASVCIRECVRAYESARESLRARKSVRECVGERVGERVRQRVWERERACELM